MANRNTSGPTTPFLGEVLTNVSETAASEGRIGAQLLETPFLSESAFRGEAEDSGGGELESFPHEELETFAEPAAELTREDFESLDELERLALDELLDEAPGVQLPRTDFESLDAVLDEVPAEEGGAVEELGAPGLDELSNEGVFEASPASGYEAVSHEDEFLTFPAGEYSGAQSLEAEAAPAQAAAMPDAFEADLEMLQAEEELREPELPVDELVEPQLPEPETEDEFAEFEIQQAELKVEVFDEYDRPITGGEYAIHQEGVPSRRGQFRHDAKGKLQITGINLAKPFIFEVRDRACAIVDGAFLNSDDPNIQYGGTWFDWMLVRAEHNADKGFWKPYRAAMKEAASAIKNNTAKGGVDKFWQHEHITRRPIGLTQSTRKGAPLKIQTVPVQIRTGPLVRYADTQRVVVWLELVTPALVKLRVKGSGREGEKEAYASTVRVGGRHFAAVEMTGLQADTFYLYTVELAPLPGSGATPVTAEEIKAVFPQLTVITHADIKRQLRGASIENKLEWLSFRTLRGKYEKLRFGTGSCRWYPGDHRKAKDAPDGDYGPDMLEKLGEWLIQNPRNQWPHFLFFGGDQIYSDEIADDHHSALIRGRFASRLPGPADSGSTAASKLVDGAWAGRFAHRYIQPKVGQNFLSAIPKHLATLDKYYEDNRALRLMRDWRLTEQQLVKQYETLKTRRKDVQKASQEAGDEKALRIALQTLPKARNLEQNVEPYRPFVKYWELYSKNMQHDPVAYRYRSVNFLLWRIPNFEKHTPVLGDQAARDIGIRRPEGGGHPSADGGKHAADFAEYSFLYERAWFMSRKVRVLLANVPTFLMFDDHEVTDDWNVDLPWLRMVHSTRDHYRMWPKTITDALCAYWIYQGWCNKAPSQWGNDPRARILAEAQRNGTDALPELRKCIYTACVGQVPQASQAEFQTGLTLDWHYQIPIDPPFLVPDCRSRRKLVAKDDDIREIKHDGSASSPMRETLDRAQLEWMRKALQGYKGSAAIIAPSTPLLMQRQVMDIMTKPEAFAKGWVGEFDIASVLALFFDSTNLGMASNELLKTFRREKDLEHMVRDKSWRDVWSLVQSLHKAGSPIKTLMLVSGDVHHSYCMTANLSGSGRPRPELLQVTCSGLQTTIRNDKSKGLAGWKSSVSADLGGHRLVPGYVMHAGSPKRIVAIYENAVALVDLSIGAEVKAEVCFFTGYKKDGSYHNDKYMFRYTSGAEYMKNWEPAIQTWREAEAEVET